MTKRVGMLVLMMVLAMGIVGVRAEEEITVKTMPPSVVKTAPLAGDTEVDPSLREITTTFSKDMMTKEMWSWCSQSPETFPEIDKTGIRYQEDKRTCVLPVKLKPGKTYVIWINTEVEPLQGFGGSFGNTVFTCISDGIQRNYVSRL